MASSLADVALQAHAEHKAEHGKKKQNSGDIVDSSRAWEHSNGSAIANGNRRSPTSPASPLPSSPLSPTARFTDSPPSSPINDHPSSSPTSPRSPGVPRSTSYAALGGPLSPPARPERSQTLPSPTSPSASKHPNPRARMLLNMPGTPTSGTVDDPFANAFTPNEREMQGVYSTRAGSAERAHASEGEGEGEDDWEDEVERSGGGGRRSRRFLPRTKGKGSKITRSEEDMRRAYPPAEDKNKQPNSRSQPPSRRHSGTNIAAASAAESSRRQSAPGPSARASAANVPPTPGGDGRHKRWAALKHKLLSGNAKQIQPRTGAAVDLVKECMVGMLPVIMLKMAVERDEHGLPRIPVFLHHLKIRVSDSINPLHNTHAIFRIECQYGDSLLRWVIYRELRDFVSLHTHFRVANVLRSVEGLPEFPKTSLPYFNLLRREGREKGSDVRRSDFARIQRDALQDYLINLIRATMFSPSANRLCKFFELSALSVHLATSDSQQGKGGYLRIYSNNSSRASAQPGLVPSVKLKRAREPKWWIVKDSYFVCTEDAHEIEPYDVFLIDSDFEIERPKRYYKQTVNVIRAPFHGDEAGLKNGQEGKDRAGPAPGTGDKTPADGVADPSQALVARAGKKQSKDVSTHTFYIKNSERRLKLVAKNERQMQQFIQSMTTMAQRSIWAGRNRFDSFAPIRLQVSAQWLVDGRDYFWQLSKAVAMARDRIYIHDWWLSPELQLRRPGQPKWRLDNLLQRKAQEGVKIYVIVYREVSNDFTPTDSNYTKQKLRSLHPNIMVQRSPSHISTGVFYYSHHEKLCVIDQTIAFMGGLDLCFGRWDTPQHACVDDGGEDESVGEQGGSSDFIWPGKDYSNPRVLDFHTLNKPEQDMYDREKVPRMPWHDVAMQIIGQPARDLSRHFVQRWNFLVRTKHHTRELPFLLPPADLTPEELERERMVGTCELQICRSCGPWSIGTPNKIEHSIQNAYLKAIQLSEHFVYIENQFFITSTVVDTTVIENQIGDALVNRIIRAYHEGTQWRAVIVIPLLPGYTYPIDHAEASSVRMIMDCQNKSICRGAHSIFARLRKEGIDPDEYISFFCLRSWGKLKNDVLTTEQLYIHAKTMTVDDRLTIIGSANINERSQRGDRDSELASIIRDTDMIDSRMGGKPYKVGRFNHTFRVRLMREHLGIDVDDMAAEDLRKTERDDVAREDAERTPWPAPEDAEHHGIEENSGPVWDPDNEQATGGDGGVVRSSSPTERAGKAVNKGVRNLKDEGGMDSGVTSLHVRAQQFARQAEGATQTAFRTQGKGTEADIEEVKEEDGKPGFSSDKVETLEEKIIREKGRSENLDDKGDARGRSDGRPDPEPRLSPVAETEPNVPNGHDAAASDKAGATLKPASSFRSRQLSSSSSANGMTGRNRAFSDASSSGDTSGREHTRSALRKNASMRGAGSNWTMPVPGPTVDPHGFQDPVCDEFYKDVWMASAVYNTEIFRKVFHCVPDDLVTTWRQYKEYVTYQEKFNRPPHDIAPDGLHEPPANIREGPGSTSAGGGGSGGGVVGQGLAEDKSPQRSASTSKRGPGGKSSPADAGFTKWEREQMEALLQELRGHLVIYPTRFLEAEDMHGNFLFNSDHLLPLPVYD